MRLALLLIATALYAEDAKKPEPQCDGEICKPSKGMIAPPEVTLEHKLDYQRARANLAMVKEQNAANEKIAQKAIEDAIQAASKDCGGIQVIADAKGDPTCPKPAEKK